MGLWDLLGTHLGNYGINSKRYIAARGLAFAAHSFDNPEELLMGTCVSETLSKPGQTRLFLEFTLCFGVPGLFTDFNRGQGRK